MDGELMIALKWMEQSGYELDRTNRLARRTTGKTKPLTYLEHVASNNGWQIITVSGSKIKKKDLPKIDNDTRAKMIRKAAAMEAKRLREKRAKMVADAWQRCKESSPTKVVAYNLGWPWTEQDEALYQYFRLVWR